MTAATVFVFCKKSPKVYTSKATVFPLNATNDNAGAANALSSLLGLSETPKSFIQEASINIVDLALSRNTREAVAIEKLPEFNNKTIAELVKLARAKPGEINYASTGVGSATWVAGELFKSMARINLLQVPYRGGGEAATAVLSGEVSVYFGPLSVLMPQVKQGRLRALAVTTAKRLSVVADIPTIAELGYPGYQSGNWYGIVAPVKTPREVVSTIRNAAAQAMNDPGINKRLADLGYVVVGDQPDEFGTFIRSEIATLAKIIQQTGAKAE